MSTQQRQRTWTAGVLFAAPGVVLALVGLTHPQHLTTDTAAHWWRMHVVLLPIFPLLGLSLALLVRRRGAVTWAVGLLAYVFAAGYTALDVLAGIATGYGIDPGVSAGDGPVPESLPRLYAIGNDLGTLGARAFLAASVLVVIDVVRRAGIRAVPPGVLLVAAAVSFLDSHIYWWRGVATVLVIGIATGWLRLLQAQDHPVAGEPGPS